LPERWCGEGEAEAEVTATGPRTKFGRTAELVRTAHVVSSQQKAVLGVVRNLAAFCGVAIAATLAYAYALGLPLTEIVALILTAVLASIPVALPATFTLASALGARALAKLGVLPTRLSAVDEAATMDVLCVDKTGTLTRNALTVAHVWALPGVDESQVLTLAALASSHGGLDPVDGAIRVAAKGKDVAADAPHRVRFVPFDPATKMSEATVASGGGDTQRVVKGAFAQVSDLAPSVPTAEAAARELQGQGFRVLAVATGPNGAMKLLGLVALSDPPRDDSAPLVAELRRLGVRTVMVTGDAPATAAIVAHAVGLDGVTRGARRRARPAWDAAAGPHARGAAGLDHPHRRDRRRGGLAGVSAGSVSDRAHGAIREPAGQPRGLRARRGSLECRHGPNEPGQPGEVEWLRRELHDGACYGWRTQNLLRFRAESREGAAMFDHNQACSGSLTLIPVRPSTSGAPFKVPRFTLIDTFQGVDWSSKGAAVQKAGRSAPRGRVVPYAIRLIHRLLREARSWVRIEPYDVSHPRPGRPVRRP
jgi:hypothetical protein